MAEPFGEIDQTPSSSKRTKQNSALRWMRSLGPDLSPEFRQLSWVGLSPEIELLSPPESESTDDFELKLRITGGIARLIYQIDGKEDVEGRGKVDIPGIGPTNLSERFTFSPGRHELVAKVSFRGDANRSKSVKAIVNVPDPAKIHRRSILYRQEFLDIEMFR
jgi:hypothetical protein